MELELELLKFIRENILLVAVAVTSGGMLVWPLLRRTGGASVDTLRATMLINQQDAVIIDVREPAELAGGKILNAKSVPLSQIEARVKELERFKDRPVIVACASGNRSRSAISHLRRHGFTQLYNLAGGIAAWRQAGLPLEK